MKLLFLSDTHNNIIEIKEQYDVIVHIGDATNFGTKDEMIVFSDWFSNLKSKYKLFIPGNHEIEFGKNIQENKKWLSGDIKVLVNDFIEIEGIKFYGSSITKPLKPEHLNTWSFTYNDAEREKFFSKIPENLDFLLTHSPLYSIFDFDCEYYNLGCPILLKEMLRKKPKYHIFGHCHAFGGYEVIFDKTHIINVATKTKTVLI